MDLQKEREAFESWFESRYDAHFMQFALDLDMYVDKHTQTSWEAWQAAKAHEAEKLKGCTVVPVELSESIAEKLALGKVEKPRQENDVVWQEIANHSYKDHLIQKKWEIIRNYKELVEAVRGGNLVKEENKKLKDIFGRELVS